MLDSLLGPGGSFELELSVRPEEVLSRISSSVGRVTFFSSSSEPFLGKVEGNRFHVFRSMKSRGHQNSFVPVLYGEVSATPAGSRIEGRFELHSFVRRFMKLWFGMLGCMAPIAVLVGVVMLLQEKWDGAMPIVIPLGMFLFGLAMVKAGRRLGRSEEKGIAEFLAGLFRDVSIGESDGQPADEGGAAGP